MATPRETTNAIKNQLSKGPGSFSNLRDLQKLARNKRQPSPNTRCQTSRLASSANTPTKVTRAGSTLIAMPQRARTTGMIDESSGRSYPVKSEPKYDLNSYEKHTSAIILLQSAIRTFLTKIQVKKFEKYKITRKKIVQEIVSTEKTYVGKLSHIRSGFCVPLQKASKLVDMDALDSQIQIISSYSQLLLTKLEKQLSEWDDKQTTIGDIFLMYTDFLKVYTQYVKYHSTIQKTIRGERKNNVKFKTILEECEKKASNQTINTFLILPIQRLPRYQLFLETLVSKTVQFHVDFPTLKQALSKMTEVTCYVDNREKEFENIRKVLLIQEQFIGKCPWLALPHRRFVREGPFMDSNTGKQHFWFLFNDLLIIARKAKENNKYNVLEVLNMNQISISGIESSHTEICLQMLGEHHQSYKSHKYLAPSEISANSWKEEFNNLKLELAASFGSIEKQERDVVHVRQKKKTHSKRRKSFRKSLTLSLSSNKSES